MTNFESLWGGGDTQGINLKALKTVTILPTNILYIFQNFTVVTVKFVVVFWVFTTCSLLGLVWLFGRRYWVHLQCYWIEVRWMHLPKASFFCNIVTNRILYPSRYTNRPTFQHEYILLLNYCLWRHEEYNFKHRCKVDPGMLSWERRTR